MTYQDLVAEIENLSLDEQLSLLATLNRLISRRVVRAAAPENSLERVRGLLKPAPGEPIPTDAELTNDYTNYLLEEVWLMRVLFDTNIVLDLFLDRTPFADEAAQLWQANTDGRLTGFVSAITLVNLFYIARRLKDRPTAFQAVGEVLAAMSVCAVDQMTLQTALTLPFADYEDAVQHASATENGVEAIVTRNVKDFTGATTLVLSPAELLSKLPPTSTKNNEPIMRSRCGAEKSGFWVEI